MSCGDPHATPCAQVLREVYEFLDGELDAHARAHVVEHLDECAPCLREFGVEREVKALIARSCGQERAPDHVRERVLLRLRSVVVEAEGSTVTVQSASVLASGDA